MPSTARFAGFLRRADVHLGATLAAAIFTVVLGLMGVLFFVASHEASEILEDALEHEVEETAAALQRGFPGPFGAWSHHDIAVSLVERDGTRRSLAGRWPSEGRLHPKDVSSLRLALASPRDCWVYAVDLGDGRRVEGALSLAEFAVERREQLGQMGVSLALGLVGLLCVAAFATRLALAPLRAATRAVECVDERHLDARVPMRGTADDLDRHARALNRVLARLEQAFERMAAFSADVAHELRTPVNRMLNLAELALLRDGDGASGDDLVAIRESAETMRRMIEDLLLLARGDVGQLQIQRRAVDLSLLAKDLLELYRPSCEERGLALRLREGGGPLQTVTDAHLVQQALSKLIENAVRHAPEGGLVEVALQGGPAGVHIAVSDSGKGIPEPERERIFDRFVQLDPARSTDGAGLGLPIARMIARALGGDLTAGTSPLGGARFDLVLPLSA